MATMERAPGATPQRPPVLELRGISKRFGAIQALRDVDFEVYLGEVLCLVGDNGAGKSTLIKTISGVYRPDAGHFLFEGREVSIARPRDATALGIETVYQDLALCDNLDVVANLFLGREVVGRAAHGLLAALDEIAMEGKAVEVLASLNVSLPSIRRPVATLSGGQRQSVAIARAVMWNSKVVILDEPTAALGLTQTRLVLDLVCRLRDRGLGVMMISHNLANVFDVADRIAVLRLGRHAATFDARKATPEQVVGAITGAAVSPGIAAAATETRTPSTGQLPR